MNNTRKTLDESNREFIFSDYELFDKERNLLMYPLLQMDQLCLTELGEYYVSPFSKFYKDENDREYFYTTFSVDYQPIQTCGVLLTPVQVSQLTTIDSSLIG